MRIVDINKLYQEDYYVMKEGKLQNWGSIRHYDKAPIPKIKQSVPQWINVNDRLPEVEGFEVLVSAINVDNGEKEIFIAFQGYRDFKWWTLDENYTKEKHNNQVSSEWKITHWMPLPEMPESEE